VLWQSDAERLDGLHVDHHLELRDVLDRQLAGLAPFAILSM
jgi:hypothetical protein